MRINSNSCTLRHLVEQLRKDGECEVLPLYAIVVNKTNYQLAQNILKRVKGQLCGFFMVDLSDNEFNRLSDLLFSLYKEELGLFSRRYNRRRRK